MKWIVFCKKKQKMLRESAWNISPKNHAFYTVSYQRSMQSFFFFPF
ncbi:hypothetical protein CHCC20335_2406 [Bacillus paralicheniformis]|nr:hypothetical protein CHCC20335_2406 [Bacillus paralicheniformis]